MAEQYLSRLKRIDKLVRKRATGSPKELAEKLEISETNVYRYISYMREMGAPIAFCVHSNSYIYTENGGFRIDFEE